LEHCTVEKHADAFTKSIEQ
jgi:hypothetical protein